MSLEKKPQPSGIENYYVIKNNKKMRFGFTTGSCAAAAAKAAAGILTEMLEPAEDGQYYIDLMTPKGIALHLRVENIRRGENWVSCGIVKDAGDDPDVTDGIMIEAKVSKREEKGIYIDGGSGVGRVTRKGLEQPVGNAAINSTPRRMIEQAVAEIAEMSGTDCGFEVIVTAVGGRETAERTFNPRLGIKGGISILGTSGIVEPMSEAALLKSIEIELKQQLALGRRSLIVTLGNYGKAYLEKLNELPMKESVKCSNYVGEVIDMAVAGGAEGMLFVAHLGKFIKLAGGIMNTHSRNADCRAELMAANAMRAGADAESVLRILDTETTDEALAILKEKNLLEQTMRIIMEKTEYYLNRRTYGGMKIEALIFSNEFGYLGETSGCREMIDTILMEEKELNER